MAHNGKAVMKKKKEEEEEEEEEKEAPSAQMTRVLSNLAHFLAMLSRDI